MASSSAQGGRSRTSSHGSAGSRGSATPPNSAGKKGQGDSSGIGAKPKVARPSDRLNPKTVDHGLRETVHPYTLLSCLGFKEMLESQGAGAKAAPLLPKVVPPLRSALIHPNNDVFERSL